MISPKILKELFDGTERSPSSSRMESKLWIVKNHFSNYKRDVYFTLRG